MGHTMEWFFTISYMLHQIYGKSTVPDEWMYCPGPEPAIKEEFPLIFLYDLNYHQVDDLVFFGNFLHRMTKILEKRNLSY